MSLLDQLGQNVNLNMQQCIELDFFSWNMRFKTIAWEMMEDRHVDLQGIVGMVSDVSRVKIDSSL